MRKTKFPENTYNQNRESLKTVGNDTTYVLVLHCWRRPYHFQIFKGFLPQILLGPFLNTLTKCRPIKTQKIIIVRRTVNIRRNHEIQCQRIITLTRLFPMHPFSTPWKHQKNLWFSDFSGGKEKVHWEPMG